MEDRLYYIYRITSPSGKVYIGLTNDLHRRKKEHERNVYKNDESIKRKALVLAYLKYGKESMKFECIFTAFNKANAKEAEKIFVDLYDAYGKGGYNMTRGGDTTCHDFDEKKLKSIIYDLKESNMSQYEIAKKYDISSASLSLIKNGKRWTTEKIDRDTTALKGSNNPNASITEEIVLEIFDRLKKGMDQIVIAKEFGLNKSIISDIARRKSWAHVETDYVWKPKGQMLSEEQVDEIIGYAKNRTYMRKELAVMYGVSKALIDKVLIGKLG